jgi:hypothetical protein
MVTKSDKLAVIDGARKTGLPWPEIARALTTAEQDNVLDQSGRTVVRAAAERSGYSLNQLRQMQRTLRVLEGLPHINAADLQRIFAWPFSHAEMLSRIAKLDQDAALNTIRQLMNEATHPSFRFLRDEYYSLRVSVSHVSPILAGQMAARKFASTCFDLLIRTKATILPAYQGDERIQIIKWPGAFQYASPTFAIGQRNRNGDLEIDAVDCYAIYSDVTEEETAKRMVQVATECTFFRNFWIFLPTRSVAEQFKSASHELKLDNVGILDFPQKGEDDRPKELTTGVPRPDRRAMLNRSVARYFKKI